MEIAYAYQEITDVPDFHGKEKLIRQKPWGTGHAVLCAAEHINSPFAVINADDYYGKNGFSMAIIAFEEYPFKTSGRGSRPGVHFMYTVSRSGSAGGRHYSGNSIAGYGNEIFISGKEKNISRSTVELAFRKAREMGAVKGPKALGIPGSGSYLYPIFLRPGVCRAD